MTSVLQYVVDKISELNPVAAKKLKKNLAKFTDEHKQIADNFLNPYLNYLESEGKNIDYAIDCYLKMTGDMFFERIKFLETGKYSNTSYKDVDARIYSNPDIMDYHMHGLVLAQFLWPDQYTRYRFFADNLMKYKPIGNYLEIGGGHGLFAAETVKQLGGAIKIEIVDISESSLNICRNLVKGENVSYVLKDIFDYDDSLKFDFITIGEVIEHLEDPAAMLRKINSILNENGTVYLTTPVNAPMIDHIYLFNNVDEIRKLLNSSGFRIVDEIQQYSDEMPVELAIQHKIPLMYACFLKKK